MATSDYVTSHNIGPFKMNNHNEKLLVLLILEMHNLCHVAIFYYATCHNIGPFKMNNHCEILFIYLFLNAQIVPCGNF